MRNRRLQVHLKPPTSSWKRAPLNLPTGPKHNMFQLRLKRLIEGSGINGQMASMLTLMGAMTVARNSKFPGFSLRRIFEICYPTVFLEDPKTAGGETGLIDEAIEAFGLAHEWTAAQTWSEVIYALKREASRQKLDRKILRAAVDAALEEGEADPS
jgi:hypothetical protein